MAVECVRRYTNEHTSVTLRLARRQGPSDDGVLHLVVARVLLGVLIVGREPPHGEGLPTHHLVHAHQHGAAAHEHDEDDDALHDVDKVEHQPGGEQSGVKRVYRIRRGIFV